MAFPSLLRRWLIFGVLSAGAALLWVTRPRLSPRDSASRLAAMQAQSASCLDNLSQISRAYALYARDFNGKIPLAIDPEDRYNKRNWTSQTTFDTPYETYLQSAPFLHVVLRPYVNSNEVFRCPSDTGWKVSRLAQSDGFGGSTGLPPAQPSSFAKYGTSYYLWTIYGFQLRTTADIPDPGHKVVLFDGDLWHGPQNRRRMGALFIDGHAEFLSIEQHRAFGPPAR